MHATVLALLLAAVSGIAMAVQGSLNTALGKIIGLLEATFIVHITATITIAVILFLFKFGNGELQRVEEAPWFYFLGGLIGVMITYGVVASIPRIGVALATTAIIVGQVSTALIIDHYGFFGLDKMPLSWPKLAGIALLAVGARMMLD